MTKVEAKRNRRRRKLFFAIIMILFVGIVLTASTYAWFTANRSVTVEAIDVNVSTSEGLQISVDAVNWKSIVTNADITGASWTGVVNQLPATTGTGANPSKPVSTVGAINSSTGFMNMYLGKIETSDTDGDNILTAVADPEANGTSGNYVAFDLFFRSSKQQMIYLTSNSKVVAKDDSASDGIQNAARIAFINQGSVAYGAEPADARAKKDGNLVMVWEPNADVHTEAGVNNAHDVYGLTTTTGPNAATLTYRGVKAPIAKTDEQKLKGDSANNANFFGDITTTPTTKAGIPTTGYLQLLQVAEGITKVRIYMWVEGQDVDCEDHASGGSITYNLQFSIDDKQGA